MRIRFLLPVALAAGTVAAPPAVASHSAPATYTGPAATGGTVEFDVSADGASVTRFALTNVSTTCGIVSAASVSTYPISNHAFSADTLGEVRFGGSFPAIQQASGTLSYRSLDFPACTSAEVGWTATTTAPPPAPRSPLAPPPGATVDTTPPPLTVTGRTPQRLGAGGTLTVGAASGAEACTVTASGTVRVRGAVFKLRQARATLAVRGKATLRLRLTARALAAVRAALRQRRTVVARITLVAVDAAGNRTARTRTIRLRA